MLTSDLGERLLSGDWRQRLNAQYALSRWLAEDFEEGMHYLGELLDSPHLWHRVAVVAPFGMRDYCRQRPERLPRIVGLLESQLAERFPPLRKNLGPYALGLLVRKYPQRMEPHLRRWSKDENEQVLWNVIMTFSQAAGKYHPLLGLDLILPLGRHPSRYVWRAAAATLANIAEHHPRLVGPLLPCWQSDPLLARLVPFIARRYSPE